MYNLLVRLNDHRIVAGLMKNKFAVVFGIEHRKGRELADYGTRNRTKA